VGALPTLTPQILGHLGNFANTAIFRNAAKYWWVTLPLGYAAWGKYQERKRKNEVTTANVIGDLAPLISVVATLVMLNNVLEQRESAAPPKPNPLNPAPGPVTEASFSTATPTARLG
jgi:hypothetical protein